MDTDGIRIHAYLAHLGLASRREVERLMDDGQVFVNKKPAKKGQKIDPARDIIRFRGKNLPLSIQREPVVVAVHKPRGVITTMKDPEGRPTVSELLPKRFGRLFPVGRLDLMSEGLIVMTNDGELANRLTHPRYEVPKVYEVKLRGDLDPSKVEYIQKGVRVGSEKYKPAEILNLRDATQSGVQKCVVTIRVYEGKNHHVRNLFEAVKCRVIKLKRISMGSVSVKGLARGAHRVLTAGQVARLREEVGLG